MTSIGAVIGERIVINLEGVAAAKCGNCGGEWLFDSTAKKDGKNLGPRRVRLHSDEARERLAEIHIEQRKEHFGS